MQIGDLVDDGLGNIGVIVELGWIFPESGNKQRAYQVHFPSTPQYSGWYDDCDLKLISRTVEEICK
jgi:hypothetical protein